MNTLKHLYNTEPVAFRSLVIAIIGCLAAFGIDMTQEQSAAVLGLTAAVAAIVFSARSKVTPTATVDAAVADAKVTGRAEAIVERAMTPTLTDDQLQAELDRIERAVQSRHSERATP